MILKLKKNLSVKGYIHTMNLIGKHKLLAEGFIRYFFKTSDYTPKKGSVFMFLVFLRF